MYEYRFDVAELPAKRRAFRFWGGSLSLHLVETVYGWENNCIDRIDSPGAWATWLRAAGLQAPGADIDGVTLAAMRQLREAIYVVARSLANRDEPDEDAIVVINRFAVIAQPPLLISRSVNRLDAVRTAALDHNHLLARIAADAVMLFTGEHQSRIRECESHRCPTLFVDHSPAGNKKWCSPACSARSSMRSHRERNRQTAA